MFVLTIALLAYSRQRVISENGNCRFPKIMHPPLSDWTLHSFNNSRMLGGSPTKPMSPMFHQGESNRIMANHARLTCYVEFMERLARVRFPASRMSQQPAHYSPVPTSLPTLTLSRNPGGDGAGSPNQTSNGGPCLLWPSGRRAVGHSEESSALVPAPLGECESHLSLGPSQAPSSFGEGMSYGDARGAIPIPRRRRPRGRRAGDFVVNAPGTFRGRGTEGRGSS